jgi:hypothetical protein
MKKSSAKPQVISKELSEWLVTKIQGLHDVLAGSMEKPGLVHQVDEMADTQRATAKILDSVTIRLTSLEAFRTAQEKTNTETALAVAGCVRKEEVKLRAQGLHWAWGAVVGVGAFLNAGLMLYLTYRLK